MQLTGDGSVPFMTRESQIPNGYLAFRTSVDPMWKLLI